MLYDLRKWLQTLKQYLVKTWIYDISECRQVRLVKAAKIGDIHLTRWMSNPSEMPFASLRIGLRF